MRTALFVIPSLAVGGTERVLLQLLQRLDRHRFRAELVVADASGPLRADVPADVPILNLNQARTRNALPGLIRHIRQSRPDVALSFHGHLNLLLAMAEPLLPRKTRLLARESCVPSLAIAHGRAPALMRLLYRLLYPRFERIVCQSADMRDDLAANFGLEPSRLAVIHNPVDGTRLRELAASGPGPSPGGKRILAVGRLTRQKGFDLLLRALARLDDPAARLTILGEGPERGALVAQAARLGLAERVELPGFQPNPWSAMAQANVFALSSRYEGFPNALLEAQALGTPAVALACPGGPNEIVIPGETGWLAPLADEETTVAGLAQAMTTALAATLDREAIARRTLERFGVEAIVRRYAALLEG